MMTELLQYEYRTEASPLTKFAMLGGREGFTNKLKYLATIAEPENWYYDSPKASNEDEKQTGVLYQYIHNTFARAQDERIIFEDENNAIMNTGLFTRNGEEIFMLFTPYINDNNWEAPPKWYLKGFCGESSHDIPVQMQDKLPQYVDYFKDNPNDMYFDTSLRILINIDHILEDNFERLPEFVRAMPREVITMLFNSAEKIMKNRISRNNRLVVPQYYKKKIMYLAPLKIAEEVIPLAIERYDNAYRVNTIFTPGMAYCNARLLMKPESNWLLGDTPHKKTISYKPQSLF